MREDYSFQADDYPNANTPVYILDNDFRNADLERYLETYRKYEPYVAILGDAYSPTQATELNDVAAQLRSERSDLTTIIVPKCQEAFTILNDDVVLGYPNGYSKLNPLDYSTLDQWRGRDIHILGGSPTKQLDAIDQLTQPLLTEDPPANIVGLDWNGVNKAAYYGEHWTPTGWERADHLSIRETVRRSLEEIKVFWQRQEVWPATEPIDEHGPAVQIPDDEIFMDKGGDPITSRDALEQAYVETYDEYGSLAFESDHYRKKFEYYEGLI